MCRGKVRVSFVVLLGCIALCWIRFELEAFATAFLLGLDLLQLCLAGECRRVFELDLQTPHLGTVTSKSALLWVNPLIPILLALIINRESLTPTAFSKTLDIDFQGLSKLNNSGLFSLLASGASLDQSFHFFFPLSFMRGRVRMLSTHSEDGPRVSVLVTRAIPVLHLRRCLPPPCLLAWHRPEQLSPSTFHGALSIL